MIVFLFMAVKEIYEKLGEVFSLFNDETLSGSHWGKEQKWTAVRLKEKLGIPVLSKHKLKLQSDLNKRHLKDCDWSCISDV